MCYEDKIESIISYNTVIPRYSDFMMLTDSIKSTDSTKINLPGHKIRMC